MDDTTHTGLPDQLSAEAAFIVRDDDVNEAGNSVSSDTEYAMLILDSHGIVRFCYRNELLCCSDCDLLGKPVGTIIPELSIREDSPGYNIAYSKFCLEHGARQRLWVKSTSGFNRQLEVSLRPLAIDSCYSLLVFLHPLVQQTSARRDMQMFIHSAELCDDIVLITDTAGVIEYVNAAFEQVTGFDRAEAIGQTVGIIGSGYHGSQFFENLWSALLDGREFRAVFVNRRKGGGTYHEEKTIRPFLGTGGITTHFVSTGRDISEQIQSVERLTYLANYDSLTELPNRNLFRDRLQQAISRATRRAGQFCLLYLDLDHFKEVNDRHGHAVGDRLLQRAAVCLKQNVREEDTVARLGGDEFAILLEEIVTSGDAEKILHKLDASLKSTIAATDFDIPVSASIGVCFFPQDGKEESTLMTHADHAMYRAKSSGGGHYIYFDAADPPLAH